MKCFSEIISIGYSVYRIHGLPWFRSLSWYFLLCSNYFFYGESLVDYFDMAINKTVSKIVSTYNIFLILYYNNKNLKFCFMYELGFFSQIWWETIYPSCCSNYCASNFKSKFYSAINFPPLKNILEPVKLKIQ